MGLRLRPRAPSRQPDQLANGESGQALLELALVTPILVLMIMAIFQFAYVIESQMGLTNAVREGARRAAATTTPAPVWADLGAWVQAELCGDASAPCDGGLLNQNVHGFDPDRLVPAMPTVTFCRYDAAGELQYRIQVDVSYEHPIFFGPMTFATDAVDGNPNGSWGMSASAQMRLENPDDGEPTFDNSLPSC